MRRNEFGTGRRSRGGVSDAFTGRRICATGGACRYRSGGDCPGGDCPGRNPDDASGGRRPGAERTDAAAEREDTADAASEEGTGYQGDRCHEERRASDDHLLEGRDARAAAAFRPHGDPDTTGCADRRVYAKSDDPSCAGARRCDVRAGKPGPGGAATADQREWKLFTAREQLVLGDRRWRGVPLVDQQSLQLGIVDHPAWLYAGTAFHDIGNIGRGRQ